MKDNKTIEALIISRDHFYELLNNPKYPDDVNSEYSIDYRSIVNTLNAEICMIREELKRISQMEAINEMPEGYRVVEHSDNAILVRMTIDHIYRDCVETIVYKGRIYEYGLIVPGGPLLRWYTLVSNESNS